MFSENFEPDDANTAKPTPPGLCTKLCRGTSALCGTVCGALCCSSPVVHIIRVVNRSTAHRVQIFALNQLGVLAAVMKSMLVWDWDEAVVAQIPLTPYLQLILGVFLVAIAWVGLKTMCMREGLAAATTRAGPEAGCCCGACSKAQSQYQGTESEDDDVGAEGEGDSHSSGAPCVHTVADVACACVWVVSMVPALCVVSVLDSDGYTAVAIISAFAAQLVVVPLWYVAEASARTLFKNMSTDMEKGSQDMALESAVNASTRNNVQMGIAVAAVVVFFAAVECVMVIDGDLDMFHTIVSCLAFFFWLTVAKYDSETCKELERLYKAIDSHRNQPEPDIMLGSGTIVRMVEAIVVKRFPPRGGHT